MASSRDTLIGPYMVHFSKPLGKGTFGAVYQATHKPDKRTAAAKRIEYQDPEIAMTNSFMVKMARKEIKGAMALNGHPNVVQYLDHFDDGAAFWLIMEYCELGDLDNYLTKHKTSPDLDTKMDLMLQCARGISFMHSFEPPFVHRDIKLKNFLVKRENGTDVVKVTDFGVAKFIEQNIGKTTPGAAFMQTFVGTPPFMAPELFEMDEELRYESSVDIYSLGLVFQVLLLYPDPETKNQLVPRAVNPEHRTMPSLGMFTLHAKKSGLTLPEVARIEESDNDKVKQIKRLIIDMTHHEGKKRKELWLVENELESLVSAGTTAVESIDSDSSEEISEKNMKNVIRGEDHKKDAIIPSNTITESFVSIASRRNPAESRESTRCSTKPVSSELSEDGKKRSFEKSDRNPLTESTVDALLDEADTPTSTEVIPSPQSETPPVDERKLAWETLPPSDSKESNVRKKSEEPEKLETPPISDEPDEESVEDSSAAASGGTSTSEPNFDLFSQPVMDIHEIMDQMPVMMTPTTKTKEEVVKPKVSPPKPALSKVPAKPVPSPSPADSKDKKETTTPEKEMLRHPQYDVSNIQDFKSLKDIMKQVEKQFEAAGYTTKQESPPKPAPRKSRKNSTPKRLNNPPETPEKCPDSPPAAVPSADKPSTSDDGMLRQFRITQYAGGLKPLSSRKSVFEQKEQEAAAASVKKPPIKPPKPKNITPGAASSPNTDNNNELRQKRLKDYGKKTDHYGGEVKDEIPGFGVTNIGDFTPLMDRIAKMYKGKENG